MIRKKNSLSWEKRIENVLMLGTFIAWNETSVFCSELDRTLEELSAYADKNPKNGLNIFELFMGGCLTKCEEIDDSGGDLGMFMDDIILKWTRCCETTGMSGENFVRKLSHWKKVDHYGFYSDIEMTVIPVLGKNFRLALEETLIKRLEQIKIEANQKPDLDNTDQHKTDYNCQSTISTIKKLYASSRNTKSLIAFCDEHGTNDEDCLNIATIFHSKKQNDKALEWAKKGLALISTAHNSKESELKKLRRNILSDSGKKNEALDDAWLEFTKYPSIYSLEIVFEFVSPKEKSSYKEKALTIFDKTNLREACSAFMRLGELERLENIISKTSDKELENIFYGEAIQMAETISKKFPKSSARIYIAQALRILEEKRSKAYYHAHDYLEKAKDLLEKHGHEDEWAKCVGKIRIEHKLKSSFMPGFNEIVAGKGAPREPTFMERVASKLDMHE